MSETVIDRVNQLGAGQPEQFVFTDRKGRHIGDVELTGVAGDSAEDPVVEARNDLDTSDAQAADEPEAQLNAIVEPIQELAPDDLPAPPEELLVEPEGPIVETVLDDPVVETELNDPIIETATDEADATPEQAQEI